MIHDCGGGRAVLQRVEVVEVDRRVVADGGVDVAPRMIADIERLVSGWHESYEAACRALEAGAEPAGPSATMACASAQATELDALARASSRPTPRMKILGLEAALEVLISRLGVKAATSDTSAAPMASRSCVSKEMTELGLGASRRAAPD